MKKLLIGLGGFALISGASLSVVSCKTKVNATYNQFVQDINQTKGSYDDLGNPLTKSGASIIYIGARDNASSQSFEAAVKSNFENDLQEAHRTLSAPWETVTASTPILFPATNATIDLNTWTIHNLTDSNLLNKIDRSADYVQITLNNVRFDATIIQVSKDELALQIISDRTPQAREQLEDAFNKASRPNYPEQKSSIIKTYKLGHQAQLFNNKQQLYNQWTASYQATWIQQRNADRGVTDVKMQLRGGSNYYGAVLEQPLTTPTYGIKSESSLEINAPITVGFDYAQPQLNFEYFTVDKINDYWNSSFFNELSSFLKKDILYQLGATTPIEPGSEANEKNIPLIKQRVDKATTIVNKIKESKGPLFLFIKNGHFVGARRGWNRYYEFGGKNTLKEGSVNYEDLISWAKATAEVWSRSTLENLETIATEGIKDWAFLSGDDKGASNWDPKTNLPTDKQENK